MCAINEEEHKGSASITEPQYQLSASSTAAFYAQTPSSMSLVSATHQPSPTPIHHPHPQTASVFMNLHNQLRFSGKIESLILNISQTVFLLSVHTNQTVLNDFKALELGLASGLGNSLKSYFKSGHVLQYPPASGIYTQSMYQQLIEPESSIGMHTQTQTIQIRSQIIISAQQQSSLIEIILIHSIKVPSDEINSEGKCQCDNVMF